VLELEIKHKHIEEQWGKFYPEKLAVSTSDADKNIARDK
jgi:hypothetical protein